MDANNIHREFIYNLDFPAIQNIIGDWGEPSYRALQIWRGLYRSLWNSPDQFTNLPNTLREQIADHFDFNSLTPIKYFASQDKETRKTLFRLPDGLAIEAVLMRYDRRNTLCISTQVGCAMGCVFCATGQMGYRRNLSSGEIVEQVLFYSRLLSSSNEKVTNVVIMGMGESLHNYDATMAAIDRLNHRDGFNFGARRFTISTVGLIPGIRRFIREKRQINLAVSLHAATDELRSSILPVNHRYPLDELFDVCKEYVDTTKRRITFEWALIQDVNDSKTQASILANRLKYFHHPHGCLCHVNIIPLNPTQNYEGRGTTRQRALEFSHILEQNGIPCTIRLRRGIDIQAGCGQLAIDSE